MKKATRTEVVRLPPTILAKNTPLSCPPVGAPCHFNLVAQDGASSRHRLLAAARRRQGRSNEIPV